MNNNLFSEYLLETIRDYIKDGTIKMDSIITQLLRIELELRSIEKCINIESDHTNN